MLDKVETNRIIDRCDAKCLEKLDVKIIVAWLLGIAQGSLAVDLL